MNSTVYLSLIAVALAGCASRDEPVERWEGALSPSGSIVPKIGDACTPADGTQVSQVVSPADVVGRGPVAINVSQVSSHIELSSLAVGDGYCIAPGGAYPNGYYTMNCSKHADCPPGSLCDDSQCRRPCTADTDCLKPSLCGAPAGTRGVRFCQCVSCEPHDTEADLENDHGRQPDAHGGTSDDIRGSPANVNGKSGILNWLLHEVIRDGIGALGRERARRSTR
jgi:hypothetical protein